MLIVEPNCDVQIFIPWIGSMIGIQRHINFGECLFLETVTRDTITDYF